MVIVLNEKGTIRIDGILTCNVGIPMYLGNHRKYHIQNLAGNDDLPKFGGK